MGKCPLGLRAGARWTAAHCGAKMIPKDMQQRAYRFRPYPAPEQTERSQVWKKRKEAFSSAKDHKAPTAQSRFPSAPGSGASPISCCSRGFRLKDGALPPVLGAGARASQAIPGAA